MERAAFRGAQTALNNCRFKRHGIIVLYDAAYCFNRLLAGRNKREFDARCELRSRVTSLTLFMQPSRQCRNDHSDYTCEHTLAVMPLYKAANPKQMSRRLRQSCKRNFSWEQMNEYIMWSDTPLKLHDDYINFNIIYLFNKY